MKRKKGIDRVIGRVRDTKQNIAERAPIAIQKKRRRGKKNMRREKSQGNIENETKIVEARMIDRESERTNTRTKMIEIKRKEEGGIARTTELEIDGSTRIGKEVGKVIRGGQNMIGVSHYRC